LNPNGPVLGQPLDRLFAAYLALAAVALLFPHRPSSWPLLLALHGLVIGLAWPAAPIGRLAADASPAAQRRIRTALDWLPLLLIPLLYTELAVLNTAVHGGRYFDDMIIGWEQALFGGQPSRAWAAAMPHLWLSELLHAAYMSYYLIIFVPPVMLFLLGRRAEFRAVAFGVMLSFFAHYMFFIFFPVQGPRYLFDPPGGAIASGFFYQLTHSLLEAGSSQGAAFPSSHIGVSVTQTLLMLRYMPRMAPLIGILTLGLALGTVYGGFHYAIDGVAGVVLGGAAYLAAGPLQQRLGRQSGGQAAARA
jgi:membrane-associated phospholipid phosphatase